MFQFLQGCHLVCKGAANGSHPFLKFYAEGDLGLLRWAREPQPQAEPFASVTRWGIPSKCFLCFGKVAQLLSWLTSGQQLTS